MKIIIIILSLFLSISLFSEEFEEFPYEYRGEDQKYELINLPKENEFLEAGFMYGYMTSSGLFLKYSFTKSLSIRLTAYYLNIEHYYNPEKFYNINISLIQSLHNSIIGEIYLLANIGIFKFDDDFNKDYVPFISLGMGYKYKTKRGINFFIELTENLFFATKKYYYYDHDKDNDSFTIMPSPVIGISVNF